MYLYNLNTTILIAFDENCLKSYFLQYTMQKQFYIFYFKTIILIKNILKNFKICIEKSNMILNQEKIKK